MKSRSSLASITAVCTAALVGSWAEPDERSPDVESAVYFVEVDRARAQAAGWTEGDASDAEVVASVVGIVKRRIDAMEREVAIEPEPGTLRMRVSLSAVEPRDRDLLAEMLSSLGMCEFLFVLDESLAKELGIDFAEEQRKLATWRESHPSQPLAAFHALDGARGAHPRVLWVDARFGDDAGVPHPLLLPDRPQDFIGAASFARASPTKDSYGYPAIDIQLSDSRAVDFERITRENTLRRLGMMVDGKLRSAPVLAATLSDNVSIEGRFSSEETARLSEAIGMQQGPLAVSVVVGPCVMKLRDAR